MHLANANPQDGIAEHETAQTDSEKRRKPKKGLVLDFEIISPIQAETGADARQNGHAVWQQIINTEILGQDGKDKKIKRGCETPDYTVKNKVAKLPV